MRVSRLTSTLAMLAAGAFLLTACGSESASTESPSAVASAASPAASSAAPSTATGGDYKIGVNFYSLTIPLYTVMADAMQAEADALGVELIITSGDFTPATQTSQLAGFVTQEVDLVLATPVSGEALIPAYKDVTGAGIPIISFANKVPDEDEDAFVGQRWEKFGVIQVQKAAEATGGKGNVFIIHGPQGADYEVQMAAGMQKELAKYPDMKVVGEVNNTDLSIAGALDLTTSALTADPNINVIIADDDSSALGAIQALDDSGIDPNSVFVAGFGGYPDAIAAMKAGGGPTFTISLKPVSWGKLNVATAVAWLNGDKPADHDVLSPYQEVTRETVNTLTDEQLN